MKICPSAVPPSPPSYRTGRRTTALGRTLLGLMSVTLATCSLTPRQKIELGGAAAIVLATLAASHSHAQTVSPGAHQTPGPAIPP